MTPLDLVIATLNGGKVRELAMLLAAPGLRLVPLHEFPGAPAPDETGSSLLENARIKARAAIRHTGLPAIADDTGLEVDALDGVPGHRAARYAGPGATDAQNVDLLLERMTSVSRERRTARFRTICVVCFPDGSERVGEGVLEGAITETPRGAGGFGYDPVFEVAGLGRTLAELDQAEKNALSHRGRAVQALARHLPLG